MKTHVLGRRAGSLRATAQSEESLTGIKFTPPAGQRVCLCPFLVIQASVLTAKYLALCDYQAVFGQYAKRMDHPMNGLA